MFKQLTILFAMALLLVSNAVAIQGDLNNDGRVDLDDFFLFADQYGGSGNADLNNDGRVDLDDFFLFADNYGAVEPIEPVLEPTPEPEPAPEPAPQPSPGPEQVPEPITPETADLDGNGVVNLGDFEIFQDSGRDFNNDGEVDLDDFFLFADQLGQVVQIPDEPQLITNPDPRDNTERVNSRLRVFSFDSLVSPGQQVRYEFYLVKGSNWRDDSANTAALNDITNIANNEPVRSFTSNSARPSLTLENLQDYTIYYWRIKAIDGNGNSYIGPVWKFFTHRGTATIDDEFVPSTLVNQKPTANILSPVGNGQTYTNGKGAFVLFKGMGNDVDGAIVSYEWLIQGIIHVKGADKNEVIVDLQNIPGNYLAQFRVQDDKNDWSDWVSFNLNIVDKFAPNRPRNPDPADGSNPQFSPVFQPYGGYQFSANGGDRDSASGFYRIQISHTPDMSQIFEDEEIIVDDYFQISNPNTGLSTSNFRQGSNFWWRIIATDSDGLTTYSPVWTFGPGVTPLEPFRAAAVADTFTVQEGGPSPAPSPPGPTPAPSPPGPTPGPGPGALANNAPVLNSIGNKNVDEGQTLTFTVSATDADGNPLTFSVSGLPSGASFANQQFSWTPSFTQSGNYQVTFTVSDGAATDSETITITVNDVIRGPVLDVISDIRVAEGRDAIIIARATDADGDAIVYSINDSKLRQVESNKFVWSTWFDDEGVYFVTVTATTPIDGRSDSQVVRIVVGDTKIDHPDVEVKEAFVMNLGGVVPFRSDLELYVNVKNIGNTDDEDVVITVLIPELNIYEQLGVFSLDSGRSYANIVDIRIVGATPGEEYFFIVKAESDKTDDLKFGSFIVG